MLFSSSLAFTRPAKHERIDSPTAMAQNDCYECGQNRDDQIDHLLDVFLGMVRGVLGKDDLGICQSYEQERDRSADENRC